jgi:hypothetical protein
MEGDLESYVKAALKSQLSEKSYEQAIHRIAPINVLKRVMDKLSKIYSRPPVRTVEFGSASDEKLLAFYQEHLEINSVMANANRFFNLHKDVFVEPYLDTETGLPKLRIVPADRFFPTSVDLVNPLRPTHLTKIMGTIKDSGGESRTLFYAYTKDEFLAFDSEKKVVTDVMMSSNNPEGINPFGEIPGVYINRSKFDLIPKVDTDTKTMTILIPVILTDLNYAHMFCSFPVLYGVGITSEGLTRSPNAFWELKADPSSEVTPQVGQVSPEFDPEKSLSLIKSQMAFWMQSRNIKPGAMGELSVENAASGIAKAIDEMDTSEDRQDQVPYFVDAEARLWSLIQKMHSVWMRDPNFQMRGVGWSVGAKVKTTFPEQRAIVDTSKAIADQKAKIEMRIQTRRGALKELYPDWDDRKIDEKLKEVEEESQQNMERKQNMTALMVKGSDQEDSKDQKQDAESDMITQPGAQPALEANA